MTRINLVMVLGARPQFIKAAPVLDALKRAGEGHGEISVRLVHTGQHYDSNMSQVFFEELDLPAPHAHLEVGSAPPATQVAQMMTRLEPVLGESEPSAVVVVGDTNSTLAGGLTAAKMGLPVAHIEAGLRSFNRVMPEELNRVLVDHLSDLLLCPSESAADNLAREGIAEGVHVTGDVMLEVLERSRPDEAATQRILEAYRVEEGSYAVATVHRAENTDDPARLSAIFEALGDLANDMPVLVPLHPRTNDVLGNEPLAPGVRIIDPLGHREMIGLASGARLGLTDSGGLQKELYWLGVPCVTMRDETEWIETVDAGWNVVAGADRQAIVDAARRMQEEVPLARPPVYGTGHASDRVVGIILERYSN